MSRLLGSAGVTRLAAWIAGALALGWLTTAGAQLALPGGHPPSAYVVGGAVVVSSFFLAPIGAAAALLGLRGARGHGAPPPRLAVVALGLNALFLSVAIALWFWIRWEASR